MFILEIITEFIVEELLINGVVRTVTRMNNVVLKWRGLAPLSIEEITLQKLRKRYQGKTAILKSTFQHLPKGTECVILKLSTREFAVVNFDKEQELVKVPVKKLLIKRKQREI